MSGHRLLQDADDSGTWRELQQRRAVFARDISALAPGEDPAPVIERFIPAILANLKPGIKFIVRPRVVNFLADTVARLIVKYVGKDQTVALGRALVGDAVQPPGPEAPSESGREAGYAIAWTLEDTIARLAQEAPETALEHEAVLEGYLLEAFAKAVPAHFPQSMIRSDASVIVRASGSEVDPSLRSG